MRISIVQWRLEVGILNFICFMRLAKFVFSMNFRTTIDFFFILLCASTLLLTCNDVELNSGRKKIKACYNFSLCHWNLNGVTFHNFSKLQLLET